MWTPARVRVAALAGAVIAGAGAGACAGSAPPRSSPRSSPREAPREESRGGSRRPLDPDTRIARISLGAASTATLTATANWHLVDGASRVVARGDSGARITLSSTQGNLRIGARGEEVARDLGPSALVMTVTGQSGGFVSVNGRRYRGQLSLSPDDSSVLVINRVPVEGYLRGVVPRELGVRGPSERAALEAQAVAARSYAVVRLGNKSRSFDLVATTGDQVYGGVDAENPLADAAVAATEGLVLYYDDRVVSAPYHSTCGGSTAEPLEIWRERGEPFLQRVSDRIPGTDRYYCDIAPRFSWERSWRGDSLSALVERYLRAYTQAPSKPLGAVRDVEIDGRTPSGRVAAIRVETERGTFRLQGNAIRYVLRSSGGELLNSTYFSPEVVKGTGGRLARLTVRGLGYGHGVGMCQWGAIGRARAGQDFRTILGTYFPGTTVARAY